MSRYIATQMFGSVVKGTFFLPKEFEGAPFLISPPPSLFLEAFGLIFHLVFIIFLIIIFISIFTLFTLKCIYL